jgi:hypothetical protein
MAKADRIVADANKEADRLNSIERGAVDKNKNRRKKVDEALKDPEAKAKLMAFLFRGDKDIENPLKDIQ